ncbi:hypothetical protein ACP275_06G071100 [Erythranthe tilingii]
MSAYGHEMEREFSAQSLLTTGGSEMGSQYTTEAGIYMSSFAATVLISGLVTLGISIMSLLVALTVMLNSCENKNSGVVEIYRNGQSYDYCRTFAHHAEINGLGSDIFPPICEDINTQYINEGLYTRDLKIAVAIAEEFFSTVRSEMDGSDFVLMDADDLLSVSETLVNEDILHDSNRDSNYLRHLFTMKLYIKLRSLRWKLILFTRKPEKQRNATVEELVSIGCNGWSSLIMRMDNEMQVDYEEFLSRQRNMLQREGFRIKGVISSQMDALRGPYLGERIFKIPNPIFRYSDEKSNSDE